MDVFQARNCYVRFGRRFLQKSAGNGSRVSVLLGVPYVKTYGLAVQASDWDGVKPEKKEKIQRDLAKLASKFHVEKAPRVGFRTKVIFNIMKIMHVKGLDSSPVEKEYWEERGWLGKARPWKK